MLAAVERTAERVIGLVLGFAMLALLCAQAAAQDARPLRGVALVIGQSGYEHLPALANPADDADAVDDLLDRLGFDTTRVVDRDARRLSRDLERFLEDAEDADVAIVYYAGHGIEAGGENFLVPVDADFSALEAAGEKLVPLSAFLAELQATVPLVIVMLDACRDNPFPPGSTVRLDAASAPVPMAEAGLGETRGATRLAAPTAQPAQDSHGAVIAFAAEPGKVALDGAPGDNSPYAAAVIRHLDAMAGEEFGMVMRMVGEEVYLKTSGRQRPWVNESLRRQLFFGKAPAPLAGEEGDILAERRQLLLTIAALPSAQRARAETLAEAGGVSMSVVYAMMQALGVDPNDDPEKTEDRLRTQIERFAALRETRQSLESADPEILRLTALADSAEEEGALAAADELREQAKQRVAALRPAREQQIETLRQRIVEDAEVYARSAETKELLFLHAAAADDYAEAASIVDDWDAALATDYRAREIAARLADAELRGTPASLDAAEEKARAALAADGGKGGAPAARLRHALGQVLFLRAQHGSDIAALGEALEVLRDAAAGADLLEPEERVRLLIDAGRATGQTGIVSNGLALLAEAESYFARAATLAEPTMPALYIEARFRTMQAVYARWAMAPDPALWARLNAEVATIVALLDSGEPDAFSARYIVKAIHMGHDLASRMNTAEALSVAAEMSEVATEIFDAERFPLIVAEIDLLRGRIALDWAERFGDFSMILHGVELQRAAVRAYEDAGTRTLQRSAEWQLALTLAAIGTREPASERLVEAVALLERMQADPSTQADAAGKLALEFQLARLRGDLAYREGDRERLRSSIDALRTIHAAAADPHSRTQAAVELGRLTYRLGSVTQAADDYRKSVEWMEAALKQHDEWRSEMTNPAPFSEIYAVYSDATAALAFTTGETSDRTRAIAANERMLALFRTLSNGPGVASAATVIASLAAQDLDQTYSADAYSTARGHIDEAEPLAEGNPGQFTSLRRAGCVLELARAAHERTAEVAGRAVSFCGMSLDAYQTFGPQEMVSPARSALRRAESLLESAAGGKAD